MILTNPDEQVWNMLTGGAGSSDFVPYYEEFLAHL